jgi:hypothetical protein
MLEFGITVEVIYTTDCRGTKKYASCLTPNGLQFVRILTPGFKTQSKRPSCSERRASGTGGIRDSTSNHRRLDWYDFRRGSPLHLSRPQGLHEMTDKELFLCPACAVVPKRLRPELDAGVVELDSNARCPLCGSDAVVSLHRLGTQVTPPTRLRTEPTAKPTAKPSPSPRNDILNFLLEHCPEAALWWDGWYSRVNDDWLFNEGERVSVTLQNRDGSEAVVVLPCQADLTTWSKIEKETKT